MFSGLRRVKKHIKPASSFSVEMCGAVTNLSHFVQSTAFVLADEGKGAAKHDLGIEISGRPPTIEEIIRTRVRYAVGPDDKTQQLFKVRRKDENYTAIRFGCKQLGNLLRHSSECLLTWLAPGQFTRIVFLFISSHSSSSPARAFGSDSVAY
ncbi:hypothetical protein SBV1_1240037 [Verrucomicrobia bacterium]|nr:hypothetical protein SBV1_1240037 [Verrucomicrobiota bacterium]